MTRLAIAVGFLAVFGIVGILAIVVIRDYFAAKKEQIDFKPKTKKQ